MPASQTQSVSYRIGKAAPGGMGAIHNPPTSLSPVRVISGNAQKVRMISGLPRQADMIVQDWQVR